MAKSNTTGIWLDDATGEVVYESPARGTQLAAPGREPTKAELASIERIQADHATFSAEQATANTAADDTDVDLDQLEATVARAVTTGLAASLTATVELHPQPVTPEQ